MDKKKIQKILSAILLVVFLLSVVGIAREYQYHRESEQARDAAKDLLTASNTESDSDTPHETTTPTADESTEEITLPPETTPPVETTAETTAAPIETTAPVETAPPEPDDTVRDLLAKSLDSLMAVNRDVIGWIEIPNSTISYPLMQGTDNTHYLNYAWDGSYNPGGSIFLDHRSDTDFSEFHKIIYGHRMYRDAMFNSLKNYSSLDYVKTHPYVYILLPDRVLRYTIFAAYDADAIDGHSYRLGLTETDGQQKYIDYCLKNSVIDTGIIPSAADGDTVLTLSTCSASGGSQTRWVTHWVLDAEFPKE